MELTKIANNRQEIAGAISLVRNAISLIRNAISFKKLLSKNAHNRDTLSLVPGN